MSGTGDICTTFIRARHRPHPRLTVTAAERVHAVQRTVEGGEARRTIRKIVFSAPETMISLRMRSIRHLGADNHTGNTLERRYASFNISHVLCGAFADLARSTAVLAPENVPKWPDAGVALVVRKQPAGSNCLLVWRKLGSNQALITLYKGMSQKETLPMTRLLLSTSIFR